MSDKVVLKLGRPRKTLSTKDRILKWRREMAEYRRTGLKEQYDEMAVLSTRLKNSYAQMQRANEMSEEDFLTHNARMNEYNDRHKALQQETDAAMFERFKEFADTYPSIYDAIMTFKDDLDEKMFMDVLNNYDRVEKGQMLA